MEALQWTMVIPKDKQEEFISFHKKTLGPTWQKFGAVKFELFKLKRERAAGQNTFPEDVFVETLCFKEGITSSEFFEKVKADGDAWELSRSYEKRFGVRDINLRVLEAV